MSAPGHSLTLRDGRTTDPGAGRTTDVGGSRRQECRLLLAGDGRTAPARSRRADERTTSASGTRQSAMSAASATVSADP